MTCKDCVDKVRGALMGVDGVQDADVSLDPPEAVVLVAKNQASTSKLAQAVARAGFKAEPQATESWSLNLTSGVSRLAEARQALLALPGVTNVTAAANTLSVTAYAPHVSTQALLAAVRKAGASASVDTEELKLRLKGPGTPQDLEKAAAKLATVRGVVTVKPSPEEASVVSLIREKGRAEMKLLDKALAGTDWSLERG